MYADSTSSQCGIRAIPWDFSARVICSMSHARDEKRLPDTDGGGGGLFSPLV